MVVKKKLSVTKALIATLSLISIITLATTVNACGSNRVLFMAIGDDIDINATNVIIGKIKNGEGGEPPSVKAVFYQRIYDESGKKVHTMKGMLKDGLVLQTDYYFYCPVFNVWFINVLLILGDGIFKTTDTDCTLTYRKLPFQMTMPNTEGKYVSVPMVMLLSPTAEYYDPDPEDPLNPETIPWEEPPKIKEKRWVLAAVLWNIGIPMDFGFGEGIFPIGPASNLTRYIEI